MGTFLLFFVVFKKLGTSLHPLSLIVYLIFYLMHDNTKAITSFCTASPVRFAKFCLNCGGQ